MKVMQFNINAHLEKSPYETRYDTKDDKTNGFTLELSDGSQIEITEKETGVLEIMGRMGHAMCVLPRSGNMIAIKNVKR